MQVQVLSCALGLTVRKKPLSSSGFFTRTPLTLAGGLPQRSTLQHRTVPHFPSRLRGLA